MEEVKKVSKSIVNYFKEFPLMLIVLLITIIGLGIYIYFIVGVSGNIPWKGGIIPFSISPEFTEDEKNIILKSMKRIEKASGGLIFIERTNQIEFLQFNRLNQSQKESGFCGDSKLNKQFGGQIINLNHECFKSMRTVLHEIIHALGFNHEHQRPDRDKYIIINYEGMSDLERRNIESLEKNIIWEKIIQHSPYDYNSIMHYNIDGEKIKLIDNNINYNYSNDLSPIDIERLKKYYELFK